MTHQQQRPVQWSRDYLKCDQCRKEHKKCLPRARDWDSRQQKCERCLRLGHACGAPMRKPKSAPVERNGHTESLRPLRRQTSRQDILAANNVDSATSQSRPIESWSSHQGPICLVSLAVIISVHELLLSRLLFLKKKRQSSMSELPRLGNVGERLSATIRQVHRAFKRAAQSLQVELADSRGLERQLFAWKMAYYNERHHNLLNIESLPEAQAYMCERDRRTAFISHDTAEARVLSCTSRVFHDSRVESRMQVESSHLDLKDYLDLESRIKKLFQNIQDFDADDTSLMLSARLEGSNLQELDSFPASHIAFFNQDLEIALLLWKRHVGRQSDVDILGRSFVHIVATSQDLDSITKVANHAPDAVKRARRDKIGLKPIDLVDGPDSQTIRSLLRKVGARSVSDSRRGQPRPVSSDVARRAETQNCFQFGSMHRNNEFLTGTPGEALEDLNGLQFCLPAAQMLGNTDISDSMDFGPSLIMDQNFGYINYPMHGQVNPFQSTQPFRGHVHFDVQNTAPVMPGYQFTPSHNCNAYYNSG